MSIQVSRNSDHEWLISLDKTFDFNCVEEFRRAYEIDKIKKDGKVVVDFRNTHYIDSSALGMLINLQKHVEPLGCKVYLANPSAEIRKIFAISRFDKKFTIQ